MSNSGYRENARRPAGKIKTFIVVFVTVASAVATINLVNATVPGSLVNLNGTSVPSYTTQNTSSSQLPSINNPTALSQQDSMTLPPGSQIYLYGAQPGGAYPSTNFTYGQIADVYGGYSTYSNSVNLMGMIAMTTSNQNGYTTGSVSYVIGGVGVSGYTNVEYNFSKNGSSLSFFVPQESLVVLIMDGGNTSNPGTGIPGLDVVASAVGSPYVPDVIIGYAYLGNGNYVFTPDNRTSNTYGNTLSGVFIFQNTLAVLKKYSITFSETGLPINTSWLVILSGVTLSSTSDTMVFTESNGTYIYGIRSNLPSFKPRPENGTITVEGSDTHVTVIFSNENSNYNLSDLNTGPQPISFKIISNPYISATYTPTIDVSSGTLAPGSTTNASISLSSASLPVTVTVPSFSIAGQSLGGQSTQITIDPLGSHYYSLPDLSFNYLVASGGIYLGVTGVVSGILSVSGNGTGPEGQKVTWSNAGSFPVEITSFKNSSGEVVISLQNLTYTLLISLVANYSTALTPGQSFTILSPTPIGSIIGNPEYVNGVYKIEKQGTFSFEAIISLFHSLYVDALLVTVMVAAIAFVSASKVRKVNETSRAVEMGYHFCPGCGTKLSDNQRFCPICGKEQPEFNKSGKSK